MKKIFFFTLLICQIMFSQKELKSEKIQFEPTLRLNVAKYLNYGPNFLADANKSDLGYGLEFGFLSYQNFSTSVGYEYVYYSTTNAEKTGNINSTRLNSITLQLLYETKLYKDFSIQPFIGIGTPTLHFKSGSTSFGKQDGIDFKIGVYTNYNINKSFSIYLGTEMLFSSYNIETVPEFVDYYKNASALKISLGVRIR